MQVIQIGLDEALKLHEEGDREKYDAFKAKFKPKKTTDDCYTPENVYQAVLGWVRAEFGLGDAEIIRPFYPGENYQAREYPDGCVVVDIIWSQNSSVQNIYTDSQYNIAA